MKHGKLSRLEAQHQADLADERRRFAEEAARPQADPRADEQGGNVPDLVSGLLDTLVKTVLIPAIHKQFGGNVPRSVLDAATDLLLQGIRRGEAGNTFQTSKQLTLSALNEALRTVDEARQ